MLGTAAVAVCWRDSEPSSRKQSSTLQEGTVMRSSESSAGLGYLSER